MNKLHVVYIPGLGDRNPAKQRRAVNFWRHYGVEAELFHANWASDEPWEKKFERLLNRIDELSKEGKVALVGASAGATAVINAYAARQEQIVGVVCISGKIHRPENIQARYRKSNPNFIPSAYACPRSLASIPKDKRKNILCIFGLFDEVIAKRDSKVDGAKNLVSPTIGHAITIGFQLTLGAAILLRFLKRRAEK